MKRKQMESFISPCTIFLLIFLIPLLTFLLSPQQFCHSIELGAYEFTRIGLLGALLSFVSQAMGPYYHNISLTWALDSCTQVVIIVQSVLYGLNHFQKTHFVKTCMILYWFGCLGTELIGNDVLLQLRVGRHSLRKQRCQEPMHTQSLRLLISD